MGPIPPLASSVNLCDPYRQRRWGSFFLTPGIEIIYNLNNSYFIFCSRRNNRQRSCIRDRLSVKLFATIPSSNGGVFLLTPRVKMNYITNGQIMLDRPREQSPRVHYYSPHNLEGTRSGSSALCTFIKFATEILVRVEGF
jgi:hypothetical protein